LFLVKFIIYILFFISSLAAAEKKAQAANPAVEIYSQDNFDSEVVQTIDPGEYYTISNKPKGPFYQIRLKDGKIGYVADTDLEIKGEGAFKPKAFSNDDEEKDVVKNKSKNKKSKKSSDDDEEEDNPDEEKMSFHGITLQLINYHEETLGGLQIGDMYAVGYKHLPMLNEYSSSFAWDVAAAFKAPAYYQELTGQPATGFAIWSGFQIVNISPLGSNTTLHYGAGPFLKLTQFEVKSATKGYTLQDLTVGLSLDAGLIFHFENFSLDANLRYYWDKKSYGALGLAVLF
jgi:hypothetical protein